MLRIKGKYIDRVRAATSPAELHDLVQKAIELEHATIPTYLCAYFTLKTGTNQAIADIIRSVAIEEMLHMSIASNLLIAIGGSPVINRPGFVPVYPGPLPMDIGDGLRVPLEKCSIPLVRDVFMKIEEPEEPIVFKSLAAGEPQYHTIGEFYAAVDAKLQELGESAFIGDFGREMVDNSWFPPDELFRITDPESASAAIEVIVRQGEGTSVSPLDPEGALAHYYRFEQIVRGRRLVKNADADHGFSFTGAPVVLDERGVWNMQPNPDPDTLPKGSRAYRLATQFAYSYTLLLNGLHKTFNGEPDAVDAAMGLMYELRLLAQEVLSTPVPDAPDLATGLSFRYQPLSF